VNLWKIAIYTSLYLTSETTDLLDFQHQVLLQLCGPLKRPTQTEDSVSSCCSMIYGDECLRIPVP